MSTTYSNADWTVSSGPVNYTVTIGATTCTSDNYVWTYKPERFIVDLPKKWKKKDALAFAKLLNTDTNTSFKVTMIIIGDVLLTDPTVHKRSLEDFVPLLKAYANDKDRKLIDTFLKKRPK